MYLLSGNLFAVTLPFGASQCSLMNEKWVAPIAEHQFMQIEPFQFLVASLATYRISLLFTKESGPARIFAKLRKAPRKRSATEDWLTCIFCFSMTASAFVCGAL